MLTGTGMSPVPAGLHLVRWKKTAISSVRAITVILILLNMVPVIVDCMSAQISSGGMSRHPPFLSEDLNGESGMNPQSVVRQGTCRTRSGGAEYAGISVHGISHLMSARSAR